MSGGNLVKICDEATFDVLHTIIDEGEALPKTHSAPFRGIEGLTETWLNKSLCNTGPDIYAIPKDIVTSKYIPDNEFVEL